MRSLEDDNEREGRMSTTYEAERVEVGYLYRETVLAVRMPRGKLLELVERVLVDHGLRGLGGEVGDRVRASARAIEHYPMGKWVDERGCGCIVGEMLCAGDLHDPTVDDRELLAGRCSVPGRCSVLEALRSRDPSHAVALITFGQRINDALVGWLWEADVEGPVDVIVVEDEREAS